MGMRIVQLMLTFRTRPLTYNEEFPNNYSLSPLTRNAEEFAVLRITLRVFDYNGCRGSQKKSQLVGNRGCGLKKGK